MTLMRTYARIDEGGKLTLPSNIKKFAGLVEGEVVELRLVPGGRVMISKKEPVRKVNAKAARITGGFAH